MAEINKMEDKLYDIPFISAPMVMKVEPNIEIKNIWDILKLEEKGRRERKKAQEC